MRAPRFFVEGVHEIGSTVEIAGGDAHKIAHVLRLRDGEAIEIVDSAGTLFTAQIGVDGATVRATLVEVVADDATAGGALAIDVAQALPKGQKMDFVVEKSTELGADAVLPFYSERTIAHDPGAAKLERWRRLAKSAAQQCGRRSVTEIRDAIPFAALLDRFGEYDAVLLPWELAPQAPLPDVLPELLDGTRRVLLVVGPEGGFTHDEATAARERGAALLWLGRRILRTETAAMALLAMIRAFRE